MIAGQLITWAAHQYGERPSLVLQDRSYSHIEMEQRSNRLAHALLALGLKPGERVAVLLENSVESLDSLFGVEKAALTYVALNARHTLAEHRDILADAQASAVIVGPQFAELTAAFATDAKLGRGGLRRVLSFGVSGSGVLDLAQACAQASPMPPCLEVRPEHYLRIAYTSGTTGQPKGVAYSHQRVHERLVNHFLAMEYGLSVDDAMLHVGPLTHAAGVYLFPCFLRGARNVILERFDPLSVLAAIERERVTHLMLVPTMMSRLVEALEDGARADCSSLKRIHYGTAPTPVTLIRRAQAVFGPILRQQYGMTEAVQPLTVLYPHEHVGDSVDGADDSIGSCGRVTANVRIVLRDAQGQEVAHGEVGEVTIAHEGVGKVEFWRRPDLLAASVRNGWYYSGDLGRFDRHGYLHIVGRNKDMIISGGFNVYAREVEDALLTHPLVLEASVIGLPDPQWGEVVAAVVVSREGEAIDATQLQAHCADRIAGYKKPRRVVFSKALPRNLAGKVVKAELAALFVDGAG